MRQPTLQPLTIVFRCKKHVNAEKQFTLHEAPLVLTIHLKRFSPLGRKIGHHVDYDEHLSVQPYMSEDQFGPAYSLYGVICHAGGGPNSGHYYAFVKGGGDLWWEMNDESVTRIGSPPVGKKNAYMLFYIRKKGQSLESAVNSTRIPRSTPHQRLNLVSGMKKRKEREGDDQEENVEDTGIKVSKPFIGPLLPSSTLNVDTPEAKRQRAEVPSTDPQAALVKSKIDAAATKAHVTLTSLDAYASESEEESDKNKTSLPGENDKPSPAREPQSRSSPPSLPPSSPISTTSFYGQPNTKKRKSHDTDADSEARKVDDARQRIPHPVNYGHRLGPSLNPFSSRMSSKPGKHRKPRGL
jgi:ubiquitin carboxyl-terminal hydrolase 36/42